MMMYSKPDPEHSKIRRACSRPALKFLLLIIMLQPAISYSTTTGGYGPFSFNEADGYGPYDYTNPKHVKEKLGLVEKHHFNADVESLRSGLTTEYPFGDLYYTLRKFPNHHRALNSVGILWRNYQKINEIPPGMSASKPADYFFERAIAWSPRDATVRLLYAIHLHASNNLEDALVRYREAEKIDPSLPELAYNLGLLYYEMGNIEQARNYALKAYRNNYPMQGLKRKLIRAGAWDKEKKN